MSDEARGTRRYESAVRRARKESTRGRIVDAAAAEFLERGYARATIPRIAARAGVAVETVYRAVDGKANLLELAVQSALAGGSERAEIAVEERPAIAAIIAEPDPRLQLLAYARTQPGVWRRAGPLLRVLQAASDTEPRLARMRRQHAVTRREGLGRFAALLAERGHLREGLGVEEAGDILWTLCAQSTYDSLVESSGWEEDRYAAWLGDLLASALLQSP